MYVYGPDYRKPFITTPSQPDGADISRNAIEFKHVDAWKYGHNLVEIKSSARAPSSRSLRSRGPARARRPSPALRRSWRTEGSCSVSWLRPPPR